MLIYPNLFNNTVLLNIGEQAVLDVQLSQER